MARESRPRRRATGHIGDDPLDELDPKVARAVAKIDARTAHATAKVEAKVEAKKARAAAKVSANAAKLAGHAARGAAALDRVAAHLDAVDLWTRAAPGARKPRLGRAELAGAAIAIADDDGIDAVSMRRLAAELDVGTMTLYHYVRTKDELLALMIDELLAEVVVPVGTELPEDWRDAITVIARRSRDSLLRHPWVLDISGAPSIGPNAVLHFDQSWQAVAGLAAGFETKLDVITAVDEYVFGYCLAERRVDADGVDHAEMLGYMDELVAAGTYPSLQQLAAEVGLDTVWTRVHEHATGTERFDRNLARLLAGFETELSG